MRTKPTNPSWDRRDFLRCSSAALALPFLGSLENGVAAAAAAESVAPAAAKRLVCVGYHLGLYKRSLFLDGAVNGGVQDADHVLRTPFTEAGLDDDFTTFSGLEHGGTSGKGHAYIQSFLTGGLRSGYSIDQLAAKHIGKDTRYESLQLCAGEVSAKGSLSFTENGIPLPVNLSPRLLYAQIFGVDAGALKSQIYATDSGKSLLDHFVEDAKSLQNGLNAEDRHKLDEYFQSIRGVEKKLHRQAVWQGRPYPKVDADFTLPEVEDLGSKMMLLNEDLMVDLIALALKNDSTRVATLTIPSTGDSLYLDENNSSDGYHGLSHFGKSQKKVDGLLEIQKRHMGALARMMKSLKETKDHQGKSLLDSTVVVAGSAMGESSNHSRRNLPVLVGGGGFDHQKHVYCATKETPNTMLCDLYVTLLQHLGVEVDSFSMSQSNFNTVFKKA